MTLSRISGPHPLLATSTLAASWLLLGVAGAADFFVDAENGSATGDGSESAPWSSLQEVVDTDLLGTEVRGGDSIWLASGNYGELQIVGVAMDEPVLIAAEADADAHFDKILLRACSGLTLRGLEVSSEAAGFLIDLDGENDGLRVEDCVLSSASDVSGWTDTDWVERVSGGISADGRQIVLRNNRLTNVSHGLSVSASESLIEYNLVDGFSADGMRGLGDYSVFQYNTVKNCYKVDDNHDDGFQSWSLGADGSVGTGEVVGIELRGNTIINYEDPNQPYRGTLQGIGCFDGTFVDWIVENNVVITDHWHGITLLGARRSRIVNNTVLDPNDESPGPPWISIEAHKDGSAPQDCLVSNNLTTALSNADSVEERSNLIIEDPAELFVDAPSYDLHLREGSPAIDQGTAENAPALDRDRIARPQGPAVDVGAYEWHAADVMPVGGSSSLPEAPPANAATNPSDGYAAPTEATGCGCQLGKARSRGQRPAPLRRVKQALALLTGLVLLRGAGRLRSKQRRRG